MRSPQYEKRSRIPSGFTAEDGSPHVFCSDCVGLWLAQCPAPKNAPRYWPIIHRRTTTDEAMRLEVCVILALRTGPKGTCAQLEGYWTRPCDFFDLGDHYPYEEHWDITGSNPNPN